jgi:succinoglycan biosynthesis protein ExoM
MNSPCLQVAVMPENTLRHTPGMVPHISVCICTYKRPQLLRMLLEKLAEQETAGLFSYSAVVVDNDQQQSAAAVVQEFSIASPMAAMYCLEAQQGISLARNKAIASADGDYVAFIDDDEFPSPTWLLTLFRTLQERKVDGVLGPVYPHFGEAAPKWVQKGGFYDRPSYPTGSVIDGQKGRTGNVLLTRKLFESGEPPFRPEFRTGEDQDFFTRMIANGHTFIWCHEAVAFETVPPVRWNRAFMARRAALQGGNSVLHRQGRLRSIVRSVVALPAYVVAAPFAFVLGQSRFMKLLLKLCYHAGRLSAAAGIDLVKEKYITE